MRNLRIRLARWFLPQGLGIVQLDDVQAVRRSMTEARDYVEKSGHLNNPNQETTRRARKRLLRYLAAMAAYLDFAFDIIKEKN